MKVPPLKPNPPFPSSWKRGAKERKRALPHKKRSHQVWEAKGFLYFMKYSLTERYGSVRFSVRGEWFWFLFSWRLKIEKNSRSLSGIEVFKGDWKLQASHPPRPFWWGILKVEIEIFKRDWNFQARLIFFFQVSVPYHKKLFGLFLKVILVLRVLWNNLRKCTVKQGKIGNLQGYFWFSGLISLVWGYF